MDRCLILIVIFVVLFQYAAVAAPSPPITSISCGSLSGTWLSNHPGVAAFLGIRYAEPPLGDLRFAPPVLSCSAGDASAESDWCLQPPILSNISQSEDCLYLNVYAPSDFASRSLPVIFWIHGGSLIAGSSYWSKNLANLVNLGDVVVVTINYRLGVFGWMALPELSAVDPRGVSGNYGLMDQQVALQWVQKHIKNFGGDPKRVTLFGQSSGGTSIFAHYVAPQSANLFHAALSLSGSANISLDLSGACKQNANFTAAVNCSNASSVVQCLRSAPAAVLNANIPSNWIFGSFGYPFPSNIAAGDQYPGLVIVDGVTVTQSFSKGMASGTALDVPLLMQVTNNEMILGLGPMGVTFNNISTAELQEYFIYSLGEANGTAVWKAYQNVTASQTNDFFITQITADFGVACALSSIAGSVPKSRKSPVYVSLVTTPPSTPPPNPFDPNVSLPFTFHAWDFVAGCADWQWMCYFGHIPSNNCSYTPSSRDIALGGTLRRMWFEMASSQRLVSGGCVPANGQSLANLHWCSPLPSGAVDAGPALRSPQCAAWQQAGFGEQNWWCD